MKNYKKIRQKPYIYGFSIVGFFAFAIGGVCVLLSFMSGFSLAKFIIVGILIMILFLFSKHVLSSPVVLSKIFDNKLPKKYSEYE